MLPDSIFSLDGWCTREKAQKLYDSVISMKPDKVVELGVFAGRSFIPMALALKANGKGEITGIDPWATTASLENYDPQDPNHIWWNNLDHGHIYNCFISSLSNYDVLSFSNHLRATSRQCVDRFEDESIDILHQDGNHSEAISCEEIKIYAQKIKPGGLWIMDDTDWESTSKAQKLILEHGFTVQEDHKAWIIYKKAAWK